MADGYENATTCSRCAAQRPSGANYCPRCGAAFSPLTTLRSTTRPSPLLERWRQLNHSLTRKELRKLLGEPKRVEPPATCEAGATERWVYEYEAVTTGKRVTGAVHISIAESRVVSWAEPDWDAVRA